MEESETFSRELQNGIRLACLLIEVGTSTVRKIFDNEVMRQGSLANLLKQNEAGMKAYLNPKKGNQRRLNYEQHRLLYPNKGKDVTSDTFDLTLLMILLDILCGIPPPPTTKDWRPHPPDSDTTLSANLVRLRYQRNSIYGHISMMNLSTQEFEIKWKKLSEILIKLGASQVDIDRYKEETLDPETQQQYKEKIGYLVTEDICTVQILLSLFSKADIKQEKTLKALEQIMNEMERIQVCSPNEMAISIREILELLQKFPEKEVISKAFCNVENKVINKLSDIESSINAHISSQVGNLSAELKEISIKKTDHISEDTARIEELVEVMKVHKGSFKVLILGTPTEDTSKKDLADLGTRIGNIPWDAILDLNFESRTTGIYDSIIECLAGQKGIKTVTYKDIKGVNDHEKELISSGEKTLWYLANGCQDIGCEPVTKIPKATMPLSNALMGILENISLKPVLVVNICHSNKQNEFSSSMGEIVRQVMEANDERVALKSSIYLVLNIGIDCALEEMYKKQGMEKVIHFHLHLRELVDALDKVYPTNKKEEKVYIPSRSGQIYLTKKEIVPFQPYMELFHKDIGKPNYGSDNPESVSKNIRLQYHKGGMLTTECLYLNGKFPIYVKRTEIEELRRAIERRLQSTKLNVKWSQLERDFFIVSHDASGGGSTVVRAVLYEFRERYPSVVIKQISEALYDGLLLIYQKSRLPLVILIDELETSNKERYQFMRKLENYGIKAQVLLTERVTLSHITDANHEDEKPYVSGKLSLEDKAAFKELYSQHNAHIGQSGRVFIYGLQAFLGESKRVSAQIQFISCNTSKPQRLLLRICCMIWKYGNFAISRTTAMKILKVLPDNMIEDDYFATLGYASDLLVPNGNGLKPAHVCIIEPLMNSQCSGAKPRSYLLQFCEDLKEVIQLCNDDHDAVNEMCYHVFSKKKRVLYQKWTQIILEMEEILHPKETSKVLRDLVESLKDGSQEPHMRALLARYLMYNAHDSNGAIAEIRKACQIQEGDSILDSKIIDSNLLSTYGNLFRQLVKNTRPKHVGKGGAVDEYMQLVRTRTEEAVNAFQLAQRSTHSGLSTPKRRIQYSAVPFIGEAKARATLLKMYFDHTYNRNMNDFLQFVTKTKDEFVRCSEKEAYEAINKLEYLQLQDRLYDEVPEGTRKSIYEVKLNLLYIHTENSQRDASMLSKIEKLSKGSSVDIGYLIRLHVKDQLKYWESLSVKELKWMVDELQIRLPANTLRSNFDSIIMAMIHLRYKQKAEQRYTLTFALECVKQWLDKFEDDFEAHFMNGLLQFVLAYEEENNATVKEAFSSLSKCRDICKRIKTTHSYRHIRFYIGNGNGLGRVIPRYASKNDHQQFEVFYGRHISQDTVKVRPFTEFIQAKIQKTSEDFNLKYIADQERLLKFHLAFAHDKIYACNVVLSDSEPM